MAEFLIKAKNNWMINADKIGWSADKIADADRQSAIGDIIQVCPDGKLSDSAHANGSFYVVRVAGLPYETALKYQESLTEEYVDAQGQTQSRMVKKRKYRIRAQDLPLAVRNILQSTHVYNTTWNAVRNYIRNKMTGVDES